MKRIRTATIHQPRYKKMISALIYARKQAGLHQSDVAVAVGLTQPHISRIESLERRMDVLELADYVTAVTGNDVEASRDLMGQVFDLVLDT